MPLLRSVISRHLSAGPSCEEKCAKPHSENLLAKHYTTPFCRLQVEMYSFHACNHIYKMLYYTILGVATNDKNNPIPKIKETPNDNSRLP